MARRRGESVQSGVIQFMREVTDGTQRFREFPLVQQLYVQLVADMLEDIQPIPGFNTLHKCLCERAAFAYCMQRKMDFDPDDAHMNWEQYDLFYKNFMKATEELFREGRTLGGDLLFKRAFVNDVMNVIQEIIQDPDVLLAISERMQRLGDESNG